MSAYLVVFLGAGLGGGARHGVTVLSLRLLGPSFPYGTLTVNVLGSLLMGVLAGVFAFKDGASPVWRLFLTTGVLGGFTTFSAFSLDAVLLWERGSTGAASAYVLGSTAAGLAALVLGLVLVRCALG